jgi:hypothetical protein
MLAVGITDGLLVATELRFRLSQLEKELYWKGSGRLQLVAGIFIESPI